MVIPPELPGSAELPESPESPGDDDLLATMAEIARGIVGADLDAATVTPESRLADDLGIDSLARIELVMDVRLRFGVVIPDDQATRLATVGDVIAEIRRLMDAAD